MNPTAIIKIFLTSLNLEDTFIGNIYVYTDNKEENFTCQVMVDFQGYNNAGRINLQHYVEDIPVEFRANNNVFNYVNNTYLEITGIHPNPNIGKFKVQIIPEL